MTSQGREEEEGRAFFKITSLPTSPLCYHQTPQPPLVPWEKKRNNCSVPDMFLRSKVQEMIPRRRSRSMNSGGGQQSHLPSQAQHASSSTVPCDGSGSGKSSALFSSPRLLHSSSLPAGSYTGTAKNPMSDSESPCSMSPTSVLDAAAAAGFASSPDVGNNRRPWCDGCAGTHGLTDALDCTDDQHKRSVLAAASRAVKVQAPLIRSCSLDRRVEFGVKNKSSWLPLRSGGEEEAPPPGEMEPSSEDYTCVISHGPNPRTVHIFGDRVVEGSGVGLAPASNRESSPGPINLPARGARGFLSL